jgi:hypothetical protein
MSCELLLKFCGIFLGVLARAILPWLRKLKEGKAKRFRKGYVFSALSSIILGFFITLLIFPQFAATGIGAPAPSLEPLVKLFCLAFGFGFGWHGIVSEAARWAGAFKEPYSDRNPPSSLPKSL